MSIYLDNAATSHPKPEGVVRAVTEALTEYNANPGRSGHPAALRAAREVLRTREGLARLLGARDALSVVFAFNCTDALNLAIKGSLCLGDHVIATRLEHNSVLRVLAELAARDRIALTLLDPRPDGFVDPEDVRSAITRRTSLIVCTHASNVTGAIQPVAAIGQVARQEGIRDLIDGAQALGGMPVDVEALHCDLYAFPGHKSLLGPQGTGGLFLRPGVVLRTLREGGAHHYLYTHSNHRMSVRFLERYGLDRWFEGWVTPEDPGFTMKPDPGAIRYILDHWRIDPAEAVMVGDREIDMRCARGTGVDGILIDPDRLVDETCAVARADDLIALLAEGDE